MTSLPLPRQGDGTPDWLQTAGGYAWRFLVLIAAVGIVVFGILQVKIVLIAVFLALVATSVLEHLVTWLERWMPRALGTVISLILLFGAFGGLLTYVIMSVSGQANQIAQDFGRGVAWITDWLEHGPLPFSVTGEDINRWIGEGQRWVVAHSGDIAGTVFSNVGSVAEVFMILALSLFCTVFFLAAGQNMWIWFLNQLPLPWPAAHARGGRRRLVHVRRLCARHGHHRAHRRRARVHPAGDRRGAAGCPARRARVHRCVHPDRRRTAGHDHRGRRRARRERAGASAHRDARDRRDRPGGGTRAAAAGHGQAGLAAPGGGGARRHRGDDPRWAARRGAGHPGHRRHLDGVLQLRHVEPPLSAPLPSVQEIIAPELEDEAEERTARGKKK